MPKSAPDRASLGALVNRRSLLKSAVSAGAAGLSLADIFRLQASARANAPTVAEPAVIQIWLSGGPSQYETYDPKPLAPVEFRGPFGTIPTCLPGVRICDMLPKHAAILDKAAILRSVHHTTDDHTAGLHWCVTGYRPRTIVPTGDFPPTHPSVGAVAAWLRGANRPGMMPYVLLGNTTQNPIFEAMFDATYIGAQHNPFRVVQDPNAADFRVENLRLAPGLTVDRVDDRRHVLARLDGLRRDRDSRGMIRAMDSFQQRAVELIASPQAQEAFDLSGEDPQLRDRYGRHRWGQATLLARRLVERGVTFVTVNSFTYSMNWDAHVNLPGEYEKALPVLDSIVPTLIEDLCERGLDRRVLVVVWGDFGRTPQINPNAGRDHWGNAMSVLLAGGGLRMGQVIGSTDETGAVPKDRPLWPQDVVAMIYRHLGIDLSATFNDHAGRPIPIVGGGEVIRELV